MSELSTANFLSSLLQVLLEIRDVPERTMKGINSKQLSLMKKEYRSALVARRLSKEKGVYARRGVICGSERPRVSTRATELVCTRSL